MQHPAAPDVFNSDGQSEEEEEREHAISNPFEPAFHVPTIALTEAEDRTQTKDWSTARAKPLLLSFLDAGQNYTPAREF